MDFRKLNFLLNLPLLLFLSCFSNSRNTELISDSILVPNEWELIESGWPIEDVTDTNNGKRTQFYYIQNKTQILNWKLKSSFIQQFKNSSQFLKLSFKYWSNSDVFETQTVVIINNVQHRISDRYKSDNVGEWMPCEFVMSYQNLSDFDIRISPGNQAIIAFKDFKIEYEIQTQNKNFNEEKGNLVDPQPKETEEYSLNQWNKYFPPPSNISDNEPKDFLFFSNDCNNGCTLGTDKIKFPDYSDKNVIKFELSFKYWIEGKDTNITLSTGTLENNTQDKWMSLSENITNIKYDKLVINVKTIKNKYNEKSFVAIRDLKIKVYCAIDPNMDPQQCDAFQCISSDKCDWNINTNFVWSKPMENLTPSTIHYYPVARDNSFEISRNDDLNENDVCFTFEYWASYKKDTKIYVNYNVKHETVKDTILTIRPKTSKTNRNFEKTTFCLRDLIALNAIEYVISLNVKQHDYSNDGINWFALKVEDFPRLSKSKWDFASKSQTFLNQMVLQDGNNRTWKDEWDQLIPDTKGLFDKESDDFIRFSATAESRTPASAQLNSLWIRYDPNLHLIDPQYSVKVLDKKLFKAFTIKPEVCDWLSHCSDVIQKLENNDEKLRIYSFKFSPFMNSRYIKLRFNIEYFQPPHETKEVKVDFELRLIHFGDPCFTSLHCQNKGICHSDEYTDIPNEPDCTCPNPWTGKYCEVDNYCDRPFKTTNQTGSEFCKSKNLECESLTNDIRCLCGVSQGENIIWESQGTGCSPIKDPEKKNWEKSGNAYYPIAKDNSLTYNFNNINTTKYDVCLQLQYKSTQIFQLDVIYKSKTSKENKLFDVSLLETQNILKFCVRDFRYSLHEDFSLALQINPIEGSLNETVFSLISFKPNVIEIDKKSVPFVSNWDLWEPSLMKNPAFSQNWRTIPENLFIKSNDNMSPFNITLRAKLNSRKESKALIISDWITNSTNFSFSENFYTIKLKKGAHNKLFRLNFKILYQENDETKLIESGAEKMHIKDFDANYSISENKILVPNSIKNPFKIIFEITYSLPAGETETDLEVSLQSLSIGDPCYKYGDRQNICENNGKCEGYGPNHYVCNCTDQSFGGNNCQFHNICNDKFDELKTYEQFCASLPSLLGSNEKKCILLSNTTFQCKCPENDYLWSPKEKRCVRNAFQKKTYLCEGKNCEIFESMLTDTKWSVKNLPIIKSLNDPILPFYYSTKNNARFNIKVDNMDTRHDACFEFYYQISGNSSLEISYENLRAISLTPTQFDGIIDWFPSRTGDREVLCATSLAKVIGTSFNIVFVAKVSNVNNEMIALRFKKQIKSYVDFREKDPKLLNELPFLTHWSFNGMNDSFKAENQWPLALPKRFWTLNPGDSISFKAIATPIQQTAYLMSNWLLKNVDGYKLRFNLSSKTNYKNFVLQIIVLDDQMQQKQVSDIIIGDKSLNNRAQENTTTAIISIDRRSTPFRVALKVDYVLLKNNSNAEFELKSVDLGDPCIFDDTTYNTCSERGICVRNGPVNDYTCKCHIGFTDKNCQTIDYCSYVHKIIPGFSMNGSEFCEERKAGNCLNGGYNGFSCSCTEETFWNFNSYECQNKPKCIAKKCDYSSEDCLEPTDSKAEAVCACKQNYVNISTTNAFKCEKYDPCNEAHRSALDPKLGKACGQSNASCIRFGDNAEDYMCVCQKGFQNRGDKTSTTCEPIFCSFPTLNPCQQFCTIDENESRKFKCTCTGLYDLNGDNCILKPNKTCSCKGDSFCGNGPEHCMCKKGYKLSYDQNGKSNGCQPDLEHPVPNTICPNGKLNKTTDNKLSCNCGQFFKLNDKNTCDLKPICGKGGIGRIDCDSRNAECKTHEKNIGEYECLCPVGKVFDDKNSINKTCIDICLYGGRSKACSDINAECDPTRVKFDNDSVEQYCVCKPGYVWSTSRPEKVCVIGKHTAEFDLTIKNIFYDSHYDKPGTKLSKTESELVRSKGQAEPVVNVDLSGFVNDLKSMNEENSKLVKRITNELEPRNFANNLIEALKSIIGMTSFGEAKDSLTLIECDKTADNFLKCIFTMNLNKPLVSYGKFNEELAKICIPYGGEPKNCFFLKPQNSYYSTSPLKSYSLVINSDTLSKNNLVNYKPCETSRIDNSCPGYTTCIEDPDPHSTLYSCVCNTDYFTSERMDFIPTEDLTNNLRAVKYECKVRDLCANNCPAREQHGNCIQSIPYRNITNYWVVPYYCSCDQQYGLSNNNKSCIGVCNGIQCNNGKCVPKGNTHSCECDEGWSGQKCDNKYKPVTGGWIAGIIVLSILLILTVGLLAIFVVRTKNFDSVSDDLDHEMVNYTNTNSYRVGEPGGGLVRVRSISQRQYHETDSLGFHREREIN